MNTQPFLPPSYKVPTEKNYMKFVEGVNRFRILSSPILGFETWEEEDGKRKPLRGKDITELAGKGETSPKHFWAMPVWNYQEEQVQILEITQKGIQMSLTALVTDEDWGSPLNYDIVVTRTGQKMDTEYSVQPKPAKAIDKAITEAYLKKSINLEALYTGDDPFKEQLLENVDPDSIPL